jgi:hypothetical protein
MSFNEAAEEACQKSDLNTQTSAELFNKRKSRDKLIFTILVFSRKV